jgi:hypothetical protein
VLGLAVLGLLIGVISLQSLLLFRHTLVLPIDGREATDRLVGTHDLEQDGVRRFRWTTAEAEYQIDAPGPGPLVVTLHLGAPPPTGGAKALQLHVPGQIIDLPLAQQPRSYYVLTTATVDLAPTYPIRITSATTTVPPDPRPIGMRFEGLELSLASGPRLPALALILAEGCLLILTAALAARLGSPWFVTGILLLALSGGMLAICWLAPTIATTFLTRLAYAALALGLITFSFLGRAEQHANTWGVTPAFLRIATAIVLLACSIRLIGALYPLYQAHDLPLNLERLLRTIGGTLISTNRSYEFRSGVTIFPPGPYLALLPALLSGVSPLLLVQGGNALVDGVAGLAVIVLTRTIGLSQRAACLAGLVYAAMPVMLTSLYWGHNAQVFGQALMAPVALALLYGIRRPGAHGFTIAALLLTFAFLSHIGVTIVAIAWLGLAWLLLGARKTINTRMWLNLTIALGLAGLAGLVLVYGPALALKLEQTNAVGERVLGERYASYGLIWSAYRISFYQLGLPILPIGLILLRRQNLRPGASELGLAGIITALCFCGVELLTGLQVRYFVFLAPIACILMAYTLDRLASHGRIGMLLAGGLTLVMLIQGCISWYNGTFLDLQMSMVPLLR